MNDAVLQMIIALVRPFYPAVSKYIPTEWVIAQARHETGNFTSAIFKENNNLFGMKQPTKRKFHGNGSNRGHASYATYVHSVIDYFEWANSWKNTLAASKSYGSFLIKVGYAEDQAYLNKLQPYIANAKIINTGLVGPGLVGVFFLGAYKFINNGKKK